jgi:hypothetical protein
MSLPVRSAGGDGSRFGRFGVKLDDDARRVLATDGTHLYDLPDQLHPVILVEYPRLGHAVVVVDGEATSDPRLDFRLVVP